MTQRGFVLGRRIIIQGAAAGGVGLLLPRAAKAATGIDALDNPPISVKQPSKVTLISIACAGSRLIAAGEHGVIIYSDDMGATWKQAQVPVNVTITCLGFATPEVGWAAGAFGVILKTNDSGATWQMQLNGIQANQLTLAAAQAAVADNDSSAGTPLALKRANAFVREGPDKPFFSVLVFNLKKVMVFGAYRQVMLTEDGGATWQDWSLHIADRLSHNLYDAQFIGSSIVVTSEAGLIFSSADGGNSFLPLASPSSATLFGVVGARDASMLVFGVAGSIYRSVDGGKTWTTVNLGTTENLTVGLQLQTSDILIASESGQLFVSKDNGVTFTKVPNVSRVSSFAIEQTSDNALIFAGRSGITTMSQSELQL